MRFSKDFGLYKWHVFVDGPTCFSTEVRRCTDLVDSLSTLRTCCGPDRMGSVTVFSPEVLIPDSEKTDDAGVANAESFDRHGDIDEKEASKRLSRSDELSNAVEVELWFLTEQGDEARQLCFVVVDVDCPFGFRLT